MITIRCTCGETYHADEQHAGRRIRCGRCGKFLEIVAHAQDAANTHTRSDSPSATHSYAPAGSYLHRTLKRRRFLWIATVSLVGILFISWGVHHIANSPEEKTSTASSRPPSGAGSAPVAAVQPVPPLCLADAKVRPQSGKELGSRYRGGLGELRIANGTDVDAVTVLIDNETGLPRRAIFIRSGESGTMMSVPTGRYRLQFRLGSDWLSERRFCRIRGTYEFDGAFDFEEVQADRAVKYSVFTVTLQPVPEGTARTHVVLDKRFELPSP